MIRATDPLDADAAIFVGRDAAVVVDSFMRGLRSSDPRIEVRWMEPGKFAIQIDTCEPLRIESIATTDAGTRKIMINGRSFGPGEGPAADHFPDHSTVLLLVSSKDDREGRALFSQILEDLGGYQKVDGDPLFRWHPSTGHMETIDDRHRFHSAVEYAAEAISAAFRLHGFELTPEMTTASMNEIRTVLGGMIPSREHVPVNDEAHPILPDFATPRPGNPAWAWPKQLPSRPASHPIAAVPAAGPSGESLCATARVA